MKRGYRPRVECPAGPRAPRVGGLSIAGIPMTPAPAVSCSPNPPRRAGDPGPVPPHPDAYSVSDVVAWFALVASAEEALADELDWIGGCRAPVCSETVTRLERLMGRLRVAARVRGELAMLDPDLLRAAGAVWVQRRAVGPVRCCATSAAASPTSVAPSAGRRPGVR